MCLNKNDNMFTFAGVENQELSHMTSVWQEPMIQDTVFNPELVSKIFCQTFFFIIIAPDQLLLSL